MLKKTVTYTDYNDVERTEDFFFNLSEAELMEMELGTTGGLAEMMKNVVKTQDTPSIITIFKDLVLKAYGVKTPDGKGFTKVDDNGVQLSIAFSQTAAYNKIFMELATDDKAAANFVNGIIPKDLSKRVSEIESKNS